MGDEGVETNKDSKKDASSNSHTYAIGKKPKKEQNKCDQTNHTTTTDYDELMDKFLEDKRQKFLEKLTLCEDKDELWWTKKQLMIDYVLDYQMYDLEGMHSVVRSARLCIIKIIMLWHQKLVVNNGK